MKFKITEVKSSLDLKSSQLDTARARLSELEVQLSRRDQMFTEQKRLLKAVKEEYQEKFNVSYFFFGFIDARGGINVFH